MAHRSARPWLAGIALGMICTLFPACTDKADASAGQPIAGDIDAQIAQRIEVRESPTIFAVFAMLNAAGYDDETRPAMHPVRKAVRGALPRLLMDTTFLRVEQYYRAHPNADPAAYAAVAMMTSGPPGFTPTPDLAPQLQKNVAYRALSDLPTLMRAFARGLPLDSLFRVHQLAHRAAIADYTAAVKREVTAALRYARVKDVGELTGTGDFGHVVVVPSLLIAYDRAFSFVIGDVFYSIEGPQNVAGFSPHEFIHAIVAPVSRDTAKYSVAQNESLVRAVTLRYGVAMDPTRDSAAVLAAAADSGKGLTLVPYFYRQLKKYEQQSDPLRTYYPHLFDEVKR
jgi:hypothetical protein